MYLPVQQSDAPNVEYGIEPESCWIRHKTFLVRMLTGGMIIFYICMTGYGASRNNGWYLAGGLLGLLVSSVSYGIYRYTQRRQAVRDEFVHELSAVITHMESSE
jgi:high-affinity Fe2+/Pb2+ permease